MDNSFLSYITNLLLLWLLILAIMLHNKGIYSLKCDQRDRHVLLNFKHTVGDPSSILSDWSPDDGRDCCEWVGIRCDNTTGRVIELSLPCSLEAYDYVCEEKKSNCLTGEFHLSLLQLEFLKYLDLSNNDFHVIIIQYDSYENSSNLHYLDLSYNEDLFIDNLHWLSHFASLKYVDFSGIDLQGKLDWLQVATLLPSLEELHLDGCQLGNINPSLHYVNFTSLEVLSLSHNAFNSEIFPNWLFNLSDVTSVNLSYNYFQGQLPKRLLNLQKLQILDFHGNKLNGPMPNWLGQLKHLQVLDVSDNLLFGPIPSTLGNLTSLFTLNLYSNNLNGNLPESFGKLLNLEMFTFYDNHLMGYVSERNFVKLSNLKVLGMGSPGLIFDFDLFWVPTFQLEEIYLIHMVGFMFPEWIYKQKSLRVLFIISSSISTFQSQDKFWDFTTQLRCICLQKNTIDWDISNVLLNSTYINLNSNKFKGNLPHLSSNVVIFSVRNNSFQGSISSLLCQKMNERRNLRYLDISNNLLSGGLTNCWKHWKSLVTISLGGNNLTGTIPPSIFNFLSNLKILHLNNNNLFGEIPLSLKNCQNLQILDVGENKFSGCIPNWISHNVKILQFRSNEFRGNIPSEICQLESLTILDFAENKISGSIPSCLHNMTAMRELASSNVVSTFCGSIFCSSSVYGDNVMLHVKGLELIYEENVKLMRAIDLSSNGMCGKIPPEIFSLSALHSLNLSHNQFEGNILEEIGSLKQLESLDLANNRFSGEIPRSLAELSFLGTLNLSFNNFSGMIPSGTQLQGFDALSYTANSELCGAPLLKDCTNIEDFEPIEENDNQEDEFLSTFYVGIGVGFAVGFLGVCVAIFFNKNFRHAYFRFLYHIRDKLYVMVVLKMYRFR